MEEIILTGISNLGVAGLVVGMLFMYSKYITKKEADATKSILDEYRIQLKELALDNRAIETAFRDYLIIQAKEHHEIIKGNTVAISQMLNFFDKQFGDYMQSRVKSQDRLSENIENFIKEINRNL